MIVSVCTEGLPAVLFWPNTTWATDYLIILGFTGAIAVPSLFSIEILLMREARPRMARVLELVACCAVATGASVLVFPYELVLKAMLQLSVIATAANLTSILLRFFDGYPPARFVFVGGVLCCSGMVVSFLVKLGVISSFPFTEAASYIGITLMIVVNSMAVSFRMNMDRKASEEGLQQLNRDLDLKVKDRTLALEELNEKLLTISITDGLTTLYNRRHFDEVFSREYKRACRQHEYLSLLLLDVDHFKAINDTSGHQFGDLCLQRIALSLLSSIRRPGDIAARYGGEEFVVVLPNTPQIGAIHLAEHINREIASLVISDEKTVRPVTVSIGVATKGPEDAVPQMALLKYADDCLYKAKKDGRNRVEWSL